MYFYFLDFKVKGDRYQIVVFQIKLAQKMIVKRQINLINTHFFGEGKKVFRGINQMQPFQNLTFLLIKNPDISDMQCVHKCGANEKCCMRLMKNVYSKFKIPDCLNVFFMKIDKCIICV